MNIDEIRRNNLRKIADEVGGVSKLAEILERDQAQVSQWINGSIKTPSTGKPRGIRTTTLRKIEEKIDKPKFWLDERHNIMGDEYITLTYHDIQSSAGSGKVAPIDYSTIFDKKIHVLEDWALENLGRNATKNIRLINNIGDSMAPTIKNGDILFVDITQRSYQGDGIYVIN